MALRSLALPLALLTACGGSDDGPYDKLTLDGSFTVGLEARVDVARDRYGVAHIRGKHLRDVGFVQGYVMAHDRLPQMDILRRYGAGTLSELFGALDPSVIDTDLEMRMHRMTHYAQLSFDMLKASPDPLDADIVGLLERFTDGVNAYAADLQGGKWQLDPALAVSFDPERFTAWSPIDSLVLGRFQSFSLSFSAPYELELTQVYQGLRAEFPAGDPRAGVAADILTFKPVGLEPTIPDFPNPAQTGGTASDGSGPRGRRAAPGAAAIDPAAAPRPLVPADVLAAARSAFSRTIYSGAFGALGPHAFMFPHAGSNNWAVGPELTGDGTAILATDQHLQLPNPSIFYPTHIVVDDGDGEREDHEIDLIGVTFPGIPGAILGSNGELAWSGTVAEHDVNDIFLETLEPCAQAACVRHGGAAVPIETFTEEIRVGALGTIVSTFSATYEVVPHHGPVLPQIDRAAHRIVPRPAARPPMSVQYTGYQPTFEIRAVTRLARARDMSAGFRALSDFTFGAQNWTMVDTSPDIGWTTHAQVPIRKPAAYGWNARTRPDQAAPFFVLSGEGQFDWTGRMSPQLVPHARTPIPGGQQHLATANADPVGATFDNDPLNGRLESGVPLYAGVTYAAGVRQERITRVIEDDPDARTREDMEALQHDSRSTVGAKLVPLMAPALAYLTSTAGAPADVVAYLAALPAADRARLATARTLLSGWTFATPAVPDASGASAATAIFNAWMHFFIEATLIDELARIDFDAWDLGSNQLLRLVHELLKPDSLLSRSAATTQPILCDDVESALAESCSRFVLSALVAAMAHLESPQGFGSADTAAWAWGRMHHLTIEPLFPNPALNLPLADERPEGGFPKNGDNFNVNRADMGWRSLAFHQSADGPAQRFVATARPGSKISVRWQLPGGVIFDSRSGHYRDLLDSYYLPEQHFDAPYATEEIVRDGETRWEFR